jgi:hypothetical protein
MKNKSSIYLKVQNKRESIGFETFKAYTSSQYTIERLVIKEAQLVSMAIPRICFQISLGMKLHFKLVNSTKVNQRRDVRFISVSFKFKDVFQSGKSSLNVRVEFLLLSSTKVNGEFY